MRHPLWSVPLLLLALAACGERSSGSEPGSDVPLLTFETSEVRLVGSGGDTLTLRVEVAATAEQRALGLMERSSLAEDAGMLFIYRGEQPGEAGYWMFHTRIPLDIAYLDAEGRIVAIRAMEPCESPDPRWCPAYPPEVPYHAALEANAGYFSRHGIAV